MKNQAEQMGSNPVIMNISNGLEKIKHELITFQCLMLDLNEKQQIQVLDELENSLKKLI